MKTTGVYTFSMWGSLLFVALTVAAMWVYPGGTFVDHASPGYDFLRNVFSDAGMTTALNGSRTRSPLAAFLYAAAIFSTRGYPRRFGVALLLFGVLLVSYILLLELGPTIKTPTGLLIQATGQKVIVYASILVVALQAMGARSRKAAGSRKPEAGR